ncbi:MAG: TolC family protein [Planctomycetes bacterium]|nr:TolC family protein [Planctomycetota bacterium]
MTKCGKDAAKFFTRGGIAGLVWCCAQLVAVAQPPAEVTPLLQIEPLPADVAPLPDAAVAPQPVGPSSLLDPDLGFQTPGVEQIPLPPELAGSPTAGELRLDEVLQSVSRTYPLLIAAIQERDIAAGEARSTRGAYDLHIQAENMTGAMGFYETNRAALRAEQYTLPGGKVWSGYRIGRGSFEPWYQERQTNDGGEFKLGYRQSLLQGLAIDKRRTAMRKADLSLAAAEPSIDKQRIYFLEYGAIQYWKWVAAGHWYLIQREMLEIAEEREAAIETRIARGLLPEIESLDNRRLVASRQAKLIQADRKFRQEAVELSLYLRDAGGTPILPGADRLPPFPEPTAPDPEQLPFDLQTAISFRPEPRYLRLQRQKLEVQLAYARNLTLPEFDALVDASKDVGQPTSSKNDKGPFQLETGLLFAVPLQRRDATGQIRTNEAAITQVRAQEQYAIERVEADVRFALTGLQTAYEEYRRAAEGVELTAQMEAAERTKFDLGNSNILFVNIREQNTADARILTVDALLEYHVAAAEYRAALGLDAGFAPQR